jgi:iron complex outermembrane recepter protein
MTTECQAVVAAIDAAAASSTGFLKRFAIGTTTLSLGLCGTAYAQEQSSAVPKRAETQPVSLEEITVTGSRIRRTTDFDSPNPTTVIDSKYLDSLGIVNVGAALTQLPSNISTFSPTTTGNSSFFTGATIANLRGLNPFFGSRTLTLVNNRRFVPTNQGDGVDLNFIPSILLEHIDVVTGGASAAYGSGAVAGVENIFLNRTLEGGKAVVDFGETSHQDGKDRHVGLAWGTSLFEGKGHFVIGGEFQKADGVGCFNARDWCHRSNSFYQDSVPATPNAPTYLLGSNVRANQISNTGVFFNPDPTATTATQLNAAGTGTVPFNLGQQPFAGNSPFNNVQGGDGPSVYQYTNLRTPVQRDVLTGMFTSALTDTINLEIDASYGKVWSKYRDQTLTANFDQIATDNAYIQGNPALMAAQAAGFPGAGAGFAFFDKDWSGQTSNYTNVSTKVKRAAIGLNGKFGASSWSWDGYYQYGVTDRDQFINDNRHLNAYALAIDSVLVNGVPECRSTATGVVPAGIDPRLATGCVPLNPFGTGTLSKAAHDYAFGYLDEQLNYKQQVLAVNASGDLAKGFGAGPLQGAAGVEYRTEKGDNIDNPGQPGYIASDFLIQYGQSFAGKVDVTEAYLEGNLPVLKGVPGAQKLEFDAAVRESRYKNTGLAGTTRETKSHNLATWKVSGIWDPVEWLRVRGSQSRDSRAANFRELYYVQKISAGGIFAYCGPANSFQVDPCNWSLEGNTDLKPEKSDTTTLGIVLTPKDLLPGFQFAADYFRIKISDAIEQASVRNTLDGCQISHIAADCALLTPAVPGDYSVITDLRALAFNGAGYLYRGIDFSGSYLLQFSANRSLNFRLLATRMIEQTTTATATGSISPVNVVGQTGTGNSFLADYQPTAKWVANLTASYDQGPFDVTAQVRFVSAGVMNYIGVTPGDPGYPNTPPNGTTYDRNSVPSYQVYSLSGSYTFQHAEAGSLQLFGVIDNLFNKDPPVATGTGGFGPTANDAGTNAVFYDTLGRSFRVGLRANF